MPRKSKEEQALYMGLLPDWNEIDRQKERFRDLEGILANPELKTPPNCLKCRFCTVIQDPDPEDEWNFDDMAAYCSLQLKSAKEKQFDAKYPGYATARIPFSFIVSGCRPHHLEDRLDAVPQTCPLLKKERMGLSTNYTN